MVMTAILWFDVYLSTGRYDWAAWQLVPIVASAPTAPAVGTTRRPTDLYLDRQGMRQPGASPPRLLSVYWLARKSQALAAFRWPFLCFGSRSASA